MKKQLFLCTVVFILTNHNLLFAIKTRTAKLGTALIGATCGVHVVYKYQRYQQHKNDTYSSVNPYKDAYYNAKAFGLVATVTTALLFWRFTPSVRLTNAINLFHINAGHVLLKNRVDSKTLFPFIDTYYKKPNQKLSHPSAVAFKELVSLREGAAYVQQLALKAQVDTSAKEVALQKRVNEFLYNAQTQVEQIDKLIVTVKSRKGFNKELADYEAVVRAKDDSSLQTIVNTMHSTS